MKKFIALVLAGTMLVSVPVLAAEKTVRNLAASEEDGGDEDEGYDDGDGDEGDEGSGENEGGGGTGSASAGGIKPNPKPPRAPMECGQAVEAPSVSAAVAEAAAAEGKTVGEYLNNVLVTIPGLENPVPIGQGGHVIINGAPSNQVFTLFKPTSAIVDSAKIFAAKLGGRLLTVARVKASVSGFRTAQVNFYMKGVKAGQNIKVFQISNGRWLEVDVIEIREDHVIVEMTSPGTLAFIEMPSK